ncbi:hypothetical protein ACR79M_11670 [Sphingobacterium spiritivorum]|uniref:hypothetical protein n=1 Tax=Sphingobacterium spiritivorum TaxID=258 RepID=UPI001919272C|nr:hypothetical protein [Sphingobacterium spiritivorum]QQT27952.1 hypothetical protein I6J02_08970 [Sphingobacterium spiritivorum]
MKFTQTLKHSFAISLLALTTLGFSSCSDDDKEIKPVVLEDSKATVQTATIVASASAKGFYNLNTNTKTDSINSTINLSGMFGASLRSSHPNTYKLGYLDKTGTSIDNITLDILKNTKFELVSSIGVDLSKIPMPNFDPAIWLSYDHGVTYQVKSIENRYVVFYKGSEFSEKADEIYVLQAEKVVAANSVGTYTIKYKKYVK